MKKLSVLFIFVLIGCATVYDPRKHGRVEDMSAAPAEPTPPTIHTARKGQRLARVKKTRALPNAFGGNDIFGRKVNVGFTEMYFLGFDGKTATFGVNDQDIDTNASTMSGASFSSGSANTQYGWGGRTNTTASAFTTSAPETYRESLPANRYEIPVDFPKEKEAYTRGIHITIVEVSRDKLLYIKQADE